MITSLELTKSIDYDSYWKIRMKQGQEKLKHRHIIFIDWIRKGSRVAILGCGCNDFPCILKKQKKCYVLGVDISQIAVSCLKKKNISAIKADISSPDFNLKVKYNYVILSEVLEHISNPEQLIKKLINKTDFFIISIPNIAYYRHRLRLGLYGKFPKQWGYHPAEHLRFWSHSDFCELLKTMSLKILSQKSSNGIIGLKDILPNLFGNQICYLVGKI